jgi:hypothetical protein
MNEKILTYVDALIDSYGESVQITEGLTFSHKETIRKIEFYSNNQYLSGKKDALGRDKPFYNVCNYRVTTAKTATDLDVKDIKFEPDSLVYTVETMLINRELFKYLKESNFSKTLNDMGKTRPKYGGVLVKKHEYDDGEGKEMEIEVVDWKNVDVDPTDILGNPIVETHYMSPGDFAQMPWDNITEVMKAHAKANKNKPAKIEIKEITGEFPLSMHPDKEDTDENSRKFVTMCFYIAYVGKKKFICYYEEIDEVEDKYRFLEWDRVPGRALGRGVVEDGFESQVWVNDSMISMKNAMELAGKVVLSTTSKKVSGNAITGINSGHIFELEDNKTISSLNLAPSAMPQFERIIELWNVQYDRVASTFNANTGEQTPAGTPYAQTALLNQVANSPFEYQREVWGIWLVEILNDWILPHLKKIIMKKHYLVSEFSEEELAVIDDSVADFEARKSLKESLLAGRPLTGGDYGQIKEAIKGTLQSLGTKREIEIPQGYLDIEGKITANITGELKNKQAMLASLDNILKTVIASFNPNTGEFGVLTDPTLSKIFGTLVEISGIPLSFAQLKGKPVQGADLSAIPSQVAPAQEAIPA